TDVQAIPALAGASYVPARKRLLLDLEKLGLTRVDNIEGMAWGPRLANGSRSLVLVSDDNFNAQQVTQILAFEVLAHPR
ncbi:MAG: esterase-like activity of phytase family protein, partial [Janthinobacterium sp.]